MIEIRNIQTITGKAVDLVVESAQTIRLEASHLLLLPGLIDPHVHFRTPGLEYKEDWKTAAQASLRGGYTTVFDMPNTQPPTISLAALQTKKWLIDQQLQQIGIPLRYQLFLGAAKDHLNEIANAKGHVIGIKVFMGCSTGNLTIDHQSLETVFQLAATYDLLIAVHAEDEALLQHNSQKFNSASSGPLPYHLHSVIRSEEVAATAVANAIALARRYQVRLYILHISTRTEINLIAKAKAEGLAVFAETTPHHLFLNDSDYAHLQGKAVINPPLRTQDHQAALFEAIQQHVIDTIGSDHAPHTLAEKAKPYPTCPSGVPGIETTLPLLLEAYHQGLLSLTQIVSLTSQRAKEIFKLSSTQDYVLVDLAASYPVTNHHLKTKCAWSPFAGRVLRGWPIYTLLKQKLYTLATLQS